MIRYLTSLMLGLVLVGVSQAQAPELKFNWRSKQVLNYRVEHTTTVSDSVEAKTDSTQTKLTIMKRWEVQSVENGIATLQLSLTAMRNEFTRPGAEPFIFDSADPAKSTPEMRAAMAKYVNTPLAIIRVDGTGRVVEVKDSKEGGPSRYETTPPFCVLVPMQSVDKGQYWERKYNITLDPPLGTGEKYPALQRYTCKQTGKEGVVLELSTAMQKEPDAVADRIPLLRFQPDGEVVLDPQTGIMRSAKLKIDRELKGHQGENSVYRFQSTYTEEYVGDK